eukprot:scaffold111261_cov28-Tisochrysis_lutea.AAC.2
MAGMPVAENTALALSKARSLLDVGQAEIKKRTTTQRALDTERPFQARGLALRQIRVVQISGNARNGATVMSFTAAANGEHTLATTPQWVQESRSLQSFRGAGRASSHRWRRSCGNACGLSRTPRRAAIPSREKLTGS